MKARASIALVQSLAVSSLMGARLVIGDRARDARIGRVSDVMDVKKELCRVEGAPRSSPCAILGCVGKGLCEHQGSGSAWAAAHLGVFIHCHGQDESKCNDEADPCFDSSTADRREHGAEGEDLLRAKLFGSPTGWRVRSFVGLRQKA